MSVCFGHPVISNLSHTLDQFCTVALNLHNSQCSVNTVWPLDGVESSAEHTVYILFYHKTTQQNTCHPANIYLFTNCTSFIPPLLFYMARTVGTASTAAPL